MKISQRAFDLCVAEEVSSKSYYERHYQRPEWPGLSSGVTVGIGYDLGQASRAKIKADWEGLVSGDMLIVMMFCSGITGNAAKAKCAEVKSAIIIPWDAAIKVFSERDVPQWTATVIKAVPGANKLTPSCLGTLFDLAYNRGAGGFNSTSERNREMLAIRNDVGAKRLADVPAQIISMKRLWPGTTGLQRRCDHRVELWKAGMLEQPGTSTEASVGPTPLDPVKDVPVNAGPARTKPPATTNTQNGTAGGIVVSGAVIAQQGGFSWGVTIGIVVAAIVVAGVFWGLVYRDRNPT